jgi:hypothetical protein
MKKMKNMKKLLLVLLLLAFNLVNAQIPYDTHTNGDISIIVKTGKSQGKMFLAINEIGIILRSKDRSRYLDFIKESYSKYSEWAKISNDNNVQEVRKDIKNMDFRGYFKYGSKWKFSTANMKSIFKVVEGKSICYIYVGVMEADDNEFMKSKGTVFYLNQDVIDELTTSLNEENINKFITSKNSVDDLFKN